MSLTWMKSRTLAVLEDHRRTAVEQPRGEDRGDAGVGVGQRLTRAVDVEEARATVGMP
jgi:hypothetical protein